jgi:uncharacterized protein
MSRAAFVLLAVSLAALVATSVHAMPADVAAPKPSFDCSTVKLNPTEKAICSSPLLSALDAETTKLYALAVAPNASAAAEVRRAQAAFDGRRTACTERANATTCLRNAYVARIEAIRQRSPEARRAEGIVFGPFAYRCAGIDGDVTAMFVNTTPTGLLALDWGKVSKVLDQAMSADGARYTGNGGTSFWSKGRGATFVPQRGQGAIQCMQQPDA